jgi:hypothetical protein
MNQEGGWLFLNQLMILQASFSYYFEQKSIIIQLNKE